MFGLSRKGRRMETAGGRRGEATERKTASPPSALARAFALPRFSSAEGLTLIELVITITVLTILTLGVIPIVKTSVQRQREYQLREALQEMREAIKEFKRDTVGMPCAAPSAAVTPASGPAPISTYADPRSKVVIGDCTIFGVENPDHYPPDLDTLVNGVSVIPRANITGAVTPDIHKNATENPLLATKKKVYLHEIPIDPMTGQRDWCLRSSYDSPDEGCSANPVNVFDVRSRSEATALNGKEKYSEW